MSSDNEFTINNSHKRVIIEVKPMGSLNDSKDDLVIDEEMAEDDVDIEALGIAPDVDENVDAYVEGMHDYSLVMDRSKRVKKKNCEIWFYRYNCIFFEYW